MDNLNELETLLRETHRQVGQIHTTIFGAEGQGGIIREHREFRARTELELQALRRHKEEINLFKAKLVAVVGVVATVASFFGSKIAAIVTKIP